MYHSLAPDVQVWHHPCALTPEEQHALLPWLETLPFKSGQAFGKTIPRKTVWFHQEQEDFCPQWTQRHKRWEAEPYDATLTRVQARVEELLPMATHFRGCLMNRYDTGLEHIQMHRDTAHGPAPTVAILSIGATRVLQFKPLRSDPLRPRSLKLASDTPALSLELESGSLLLMYGAAQERFCHGVPLAPHCAERRYSLTFREC